MKKEATIEYLYMGEFRSLDVPRDLAEMVKAALIAGGANGVQIYWRIS